MHWKNIVANELFNISVVQVFSFFNFLYVNLIEYLETVVYFIGWLFKSMG